MQINQALHLVKVDHKAARQDGWPRGIYIQWIDEPPQDRGFYLVSGTFADLVGRYYITALDVTAEWSIKKNVQLTSEQLMRRRR